MRQNSVIPFQVAFDDFLAGKGSWGAFGITFKEFVMDKHLTHYLNVEVGILHLPHLPPFQRQLRNSVLRFHIN